MKKEGILNSLPFRLLVALGVCEGISVNRISCDRIYA